MEKFLSALLLLISSAVFGQTQIKFDRFSLENGLKVILHEDHTTPNVVISVLYHVGSKNEKPERTGFAHFFEHLMFEGSENIARGEYDKYVSRAGGALNAYTSQDRTYYYEFLPSNYLELGLWLESERMKHAVVDSKGIETQRAVVKEERKQRMDNQPYGTLMEQVFVRLFDKHPYRWMPIGSMEHLDAASDEDYQQFYKDFYLPDNAVLTIAGDINKSTAKALVEKYFSTIPKSTKPIYRPTITEAPLNGPKRDTVYDRVQLPALIIGHRTPAQGSKDYYAMEMLNTLLSNGNSSRIYRSLVDEKQLAIQAGSFQFPLEDPGLGISYGIANMGVELSDIEKAILAEIEKVQNQPISDQELKKLQNQIENQFVDKLSSVEGIAENLAVYETHYGDASLINTEINRYLAVTKEDIQRVANLYFDEKNRLVLFWLPKSN
ncbi:peptidase M16 [Bacteroidota bacterium]|jgi:predicted Zn-dependent peptidase|nr:peptidase M16 [Bacteroidota bacterium]